MELAYYNPSVVAHRLNHDLPGMARFAYLFKYFFGTTMVMADRTDTIRIPVHVRPMSRVPAFKPMSRSFEDICNERAKELLSRADALDVQVYVLWSGGIDSTLVLVSLLKNASAAQKQRIIVLLSEESIAENRRFYTEHIRGKIRREPSRLFPYLLGTKHLFVSGELNDQLFGAAAPGELMTAYGDAIAHAPYTRDLLFSFYNEKVRDDGVTNFYLDLFQRVVDIAPIPIVSYIDYFWWINFTLKWQSVQLRTISFVAQRTAGGITPEYIRERYAPFYDTETFQLWSMNNLDKRMKDTWNTYKWPCKDIIYDYTKDAEYRDFKKKHGSLYFILLQQNAFSFIDDSFHLYRTLPPEEYFNPDNDFV